ncbi:ABC transporter substrate-binding protein [Methyloligella sp. 2.7D]|uniref:ABC transporter substrate-binding protein n=1 Tax=unclassified Methyloligella TaxID=2625955 RepID=UPI00157D3F4F|nr:ABC transporter substrate-binding protein [Methyloligella sp. GL2]QKP77943.1 ABC transporter substrate-binding protein [Methyloligella sp. GL2]
MTIQRNPKTFRRKAGSAFAAALLTTATITPALAEDKDDIVIGYAAAVTGALAPYDSPDGVQCRIDQINDAGGVLGGRKLKLELRDMKSDSALSATVGQELLDMGAAAILSPPTDDTSIPIATLAAATSTPVLSVGGTQPAFPLAMPTNGYLVPYGDNASASAAAQYAWSQGMKTAVLMISHDVGSYSLMTPEYFADAFEHLGGKVLGRINYNSGLSDYSAQIAEIQAMDPKPDMIFGGLIVPEAGVLPRQLDAAGLDIPVYSTDGPDDPGVLEISGKGGKLLHFVTHGFPAEGSPLAEFYADCEKRGYKVQNIFFGLGGDAVTVLADAIENAKSAEPAKVNAAIKELDGIEGITTDSITYKDRKGIPLKGMSVMEIKDGKFSMIEPIKPDYVAAP